MSLGRALLDAAVFIYAVGGPHVLREPCVALVRGLGDQRYRGEASVLAIQELLHQRARRTGDRAAARKAAQKAALTCPLHDLTFADLDLGVRLYGDSARLDAIDALHAATALNQGIPTIISPDPAFDDVSGLRRLDPAQAAGLL